MALDDDGCKECIIRLGEERVTAFTEAYVKLLNNPDNESYKHEVAHWTEMLKDPFTDLDDGQIERLKRQIRESRKK